MNFLKTVSLGVICLQFSILPVAAQALHKNKELPPSAYKLSQVNVTGTERYKPDDVIRASGLQIGQTVHDEDFKGAIRVLGDSGAFSAIGYTFEFSTEGTKWELKVKDADHFVPVRFENLVWFSHQELFEKLHGLVPLFDGQVPITGKLIDDVSEAVQGMIDERKLPVRVDYTRLPSDGPTEAFEFTATGPRILIDSVKFSGAGDTELPRLEAAAKDLQGEQYLQSAVHSEEQKLFLPVYESEGYLKASCGDNETKVVQGDTDDVQVEVTVPVIPGPQYILDSIELSGYKVIPVDTLRKEIPQQPGTPANDIQIRKDIENIKKLYEQKGYMEAKVDLDEPFDETKHTVRYVLRVSEGDIYKMGEVEILGVDSRTRDKLQNLWSLKTGDPYDSGYPARFITQALKQVLTTGEWNTDVHETPDQKDKDVDVTVRFDLKQPLQ